MWELYTAQRPFPGVPEALLGGQIVQGKRPVFPEDVPEGYKALAETCWCEDASERPSFRDILHTLNQLLDTDAGHTRRIRVREMGCSLRLVVVLRDD